MFFKQYRFVFFVNFHAASTCGYAKYVFKTSLFPWGRSDQSQALNTGPKYSVIVQKDAKTWKAYERVSGYSLEVITPHGKLHSRKLEKKKKMYRYSVCAHWRNVTCQIGKVISRSIFQISFRPGGPWYNQKIKEICMWLFWKKLYRSFTFTKDFFFFENWCRKCLA